MADQYEQCMEMDSTNWAMAMHMKWINHRLKRQRITIRMCLIKDDTSSSTTWPISIMIQRPKTTLVLTSASLC